MKKYIYIPFAVWVVAATALGIVFKNYYLMTSWLWLPAVVLLTLAVAFEVFVDIGSLLRKKQERSIKDGCDICLFNESAKYSEDNKCLGCVMDENHKFGEMCRYYKRHITPKD